MLRITEQSDERSLTFKLEGRLVGEWTSELERCWNNAVSDRQPDAIRVELVEVTYVDDAGKQLLTQMASMGAALIAADVMTSALVEQITLQLAGEG
ncbi:MAG: hypothetical protein JNK38_03520 [Acidobacteria bacterium]|nr:hypothetical protein [Acidobacteriota bacterium]